MESGVGGFPRGLLWTSGRRFGKARGRSFFPSIVHDVGVIELTIWFEDLKELRDYDIDNLALELDGTQFRFRSADSGRTIKRLWRNAGLDWNIGDTVAVRILDLRVAEQEAAEPLTVEVQGAPESHDGANPTTLRLAFSEDVAVEPDAMRDHALLTSGGAVTAAARVDGRSDLWELTIEPAGNGAVTVALAATAPCGDPGAICTAGGKALANAPAATVQGPPELAVAGAEVREGPGAALEFAVTLSRASAATVTVDYATSDETAAAGADYTATAGTLTFLAGETAKTVTVSVLDDVVDEGTETLTLANPAGGNAYLADAAATGDATRLRLGLEGTWRGLALGGGTLEPRLELGLRHDGGDAETGFGLDAGAGLAWAHPRNGLRLQLSGRGLLSHESRGFREQGVAGSLSWQPRPQRGRGPKLTLTRTLGGASSGGAGALLGQRTLAGLGANDTGDPLESRRLEVGFGYGFAVLGDRFTSTPEIGLGMSNGHREYRLGWRLTLARSGISALELALEASRREADNDNGSGPGAEPEHALGLRLTARW